MPKEHVLTMHDVSNIWRVPLILEGQDAHSVICRCGARGVAGRMWSAGCGAGGGGVQRIGCGLWSALCFALRAGFGVWSVGSPATSVCGARVGGKVAAVCVADPTLVLKVHEADGECEVWSLAPPSVPECGRAGWASVGGMSRRCGCPEVWVLRK
eukprot:350849-Chlamydomonas_euryale.AAC.2